MIKPSNMSIQTRQAIHKRIKLCLFAIPFVLCLNLSYLVHFTNYMEVPRVLSSEGIVTNKMVRDGRYYLFLNDSGSTELVTKEAYDEFKVGSEAKLYVKGPQSTKQVLSVIALIIIYGIALIGGVIWLCTLVGKYNDWVKGY